ncbi:MAG TPA: helix-turn-helix transcriptional regulator [Solirubrobacteraceae bacterium]|jgi:transcriptional regulator with XRE-family HTH domain
MAAVQSAQHQALGNALRELRVARELSQEELAYRSGLHRNYVGACERGEINLSFRVLLQFTVGLGVSLSEIVCHYERLDEAETSKAAGRRG